MRSSAIAYRPEIDGLRALAILLVLGFHLWPTHLTGGFVGVDVFFVISGFLITTIITKRQSEENFSLLQFYQARVLRLFPVLILVAASTLAAGWFMLVPLDYERLGRHLISTFGFHENLVLRRESGYFDNEIHLKPLAHIWSFSVEEQFYFVYPLLLMVLNRLVRGQGVILLILAALSFIASAYEAHRVPQDAYLLPWMRIWEFLIGALLTLRPTQHFNIPHYLHALVSAIGITLIISSAIRLTPSSSFPGLGALPTVLGAAMIIASGSASVLNRVIFSHPWMIGIGLVSYPLYLWHWPLLSFLRFWKGSFVSTQAILLTAALAFLLAFLSYRLIELPLAKSGSRRFKVRALIVIALILLLTGFALSRTHGFPSRFPPLPTGMIPKSNNFPLEWRFGECLLFKTQGPSSFAPKCFGDDAPAGILRDQLTRVLWGDSYAAHLYPGFRMKYEGRAQIAQLTAVACPPLLTLEEMHPNCHKVNDFVMDYLSKHPSVDLHLAANWSGIFKDRDLEPIERTLAKLKEMGIQNITLYGPPPHWEKPLPTLMIEWHRDHVEDLIPMRMVPEAFDFTDDLDRRLEAIALSHRVQYTSIIKRVCIDKACLARVQTKLTSLDFGHLTPSGSMAVFEVSDRRPEREPSSEPADSRPMSENVLAPEH